ncbi:hypothetical protein YC2023_017761 [Brassica napus]
MADIYNQELRENSASRKREIFDDLASLLWHSVGTNPALLQNHTITITGLEVESGKKAMQEVFLNWWMNLCVQHPGKDQMTYQALSPLRNLESQHLRLAESASRWETVEAG